MSLSFELPPTGVEQPPAFTTVDACRAWIAELPATNAAQGQSLLHAQLMLLHRYTLSPALRLTILDTLLPTVNNVQEDSLKKFVGRALPLAPPEQAALDASLAIWLGLAQGYLRCFDAALSGDSEVAPKLAMIGQRIFALFADWQVTLYRGSQLPEPGYWKELHRVFAALEEHKLLTTPVQDAARFGSTPTRPLAAYAECHLLHCANPFELSARHLTWTARWARRWGIKIELLTAPPDDIRNRAMPLWFDIDSDQSTSYAPRPAPGGRWLETTELRKSIVARLTLLEQGRSPTDLQLGDDVTQPTAGQLLNRLLLRWCKGGIPRSQERRPATGTCQLVVGMSAAYTQFSGGHATDAFAAKGDTKLREEQERYLMFGTRGPMAAKKTTLTGAPFEEWNASDEWRMLDESIGGVRLHRAAKSGARIAPGTVIAAKLPGADDYQLGNARWVLRESAESLAIGIELFSGPPRYVTVRPADLTGNNPFRSGFLLPAQQSGGSVVPSSLMAPVGTFRIGRIVEVRVDDNTLKLKLAQLLDRGNDFERCAYQQITADPV